MGYTRHILVDEVKYYPEHIEKMSKQEIKTLCSFLEKERDLRFVQANCIEEAKHIVDNIIFSYF